jgi:hypothetical protein
MLGINGGQKRIIDRNAIGSSDHAPFRFRRRAHQDIGAAGFLGLRGHDQLRGFGRARNASMRAV